MTDKAASSILLERLRDPGFTPRLRELDALIDLLGDDDLEHLAEKAIKRLGSQAFEGLSSRFGPSRSPLRARIAKAIGRIAPDERAIEALLVALDDGDAKTRRNAAIALGRVVRPDIETALLAMWERDQRPEMRRTLAASLGKVGTVRSLSLLHAAVRSDDPELVRIAHRACAMIDRTASRDTPSRIDAARSPRRPVDILAYARSGLEDLLAGELSEIAAVVDVHISGPGRVRARLAGSIDALFSARTMLSFRFPLPAEAAKSSEASSETIARAVAGDYARDIFTAWTNGHVRYRIAWAEGGHKRAATWDVARAIAARAPHLVNDPTASTWEIVVSPGDHAIETAIVPRALPDPRFTWRRGDVPAASHPTIAAALARVGGVREDDVVWDPFVGSGAELIERALLGPYRSLSGNDIDVRALGVARENLSAAGFDARLVQRSALEPAPPGVTLILTNPPMGRRAARDASTGEMLDRFVAHAAAALAPRGRLVWMAPWPKRARAAGSRAGMMLDGARTVDMGGFEVEMQRWIR